MPSKFPINIKVLHTAEKPYTEFFSESLVWHLFPSIVFAKHYSEYKKGEFDEYPLSEFETKKVEEGTNKVRNSQQFNQFIDKKLIG